MEEKNQIQSEVEDILTDNFGIAPEDYDDNTELGSKGLDLDSLGAIELVELIDMKLDISITDEELEETETIGDLKNLIEQKG